MADSYIYFTYVERKRKLDDDKASFYDFNILRHEFLYLVMLLDENILLISINLVSLMKSLHSWFSREVSDDTWGKYANS